MQTRIAHEVLDHHPRFRLGGAASTLGLPRDVPAEDANPAEASQPAGARGSGRFTPEKRVGLVIASILRYGLLAPLAGVILIAACSRATPDNYAKLESGMSRDEVYAILGKPDDVAGGGIGKLTMSAETWKGPKNTIQVTFAGDKVALKTISPTGETESP